MISTQLSMRRGEKITKAQILKGLEIIPASDSVGGCKLVTVKREEWKRRPFWRVCYAKVDYLEATCSLLLHPPIVVIDMPPSEF